MFATSKLASICLINSVSEIQEMLIFATKNSTSVMTSVMEFSPWDVPVP